MKIVGLLTLDTHTYNYGGALQQYALFTTLCNLGFDCEVIDFRKETEYPMFSYKRSIKYITIGKIIGKIRKNKPFKLDKKIKCQIENRHLLFDSFRDNYITLSQQCDKQELYKIQERYNAVVCGSDQIWNPSMTLPSFFLDFVDENKNKVIYAASIGRNRLSNMEEKVYKKYINKLDYISVREERAKAILDDIGISKDIEIVLDPTLLIEVNVWKKLAGEIPIYKGHYIFCYFLDINENKKSVALSLAQKFHLNIISIPYLHETCNVLDENFSNYTETVGPVQFLNLILNADYVLTDSFHASVFSILFNKKFRVFGRGHGKKSMNSRLETLLKYIGHEEYLLDPSELMNCNIQKEELFDFSILNIKRKQSINWLYNSLDGPKDKEYSRAFVERRI